MNEDLLHYIWRYKRFSLHNLTTTDGEPIEIIDLGLPNTNAGADFSNAKIKIKNLIWAGDVEIHLKSSDWNRHQHNKNNAYNNVILHVVAECDCKIFDTNNREIPQLEIKIPEGLQEKTFSQQILFIPCEKSIPKLSPFTKQTWLESLLFERFIRKTNDIKELLVQNGNDWENTFYVFLARNFGFGKNADAFMFLAKSLPLNIIRKHKDNLLQVEAMLFGQADLLPQNSSETYINNLEREYKFLQQKFQLVPISAHLWKMFRLRPMNFPHIRIAQFAALLQKSDNLFSKIIKTPSIEYLRDLLYVDVSDFWNTHYNFSQQSKRISKHLTHATLDTIIINTIVPFLFAYGQMQGQENLCNQAVKLLYNLPAEKNKIVEKFNNLKFITLSAADTQALLQLKNCYCDTKKCYRCRFYHDITGQLFNEKL